MGERLGHRKPESAGAPAMLTLMLGMMAFQFAAMPPGDDVVAQYEERSFEVPGTDSPRTLHFRLLRPIQVEPDKKYPIMLYLHGAGERGDDNKLQLMYLPEWMTRKEWRQKYACYLMAPQLPRGRYWAPLRVSQGAPNASTAAPSEGELVYRAMEALFKELPVDQQRVYLTGLSMGGFGSWALAAAHPERFAAVAPICGGGDPAWAERLKNVPIWAVHGDADKVVPPQRSRDMIAAIKAVGGSARYTELKGVAHDSWTPAYNDPDGILPWIFEQRK